MDKGKGKSVRIDLVEQTRQLRLQAEALEKKVAMARGTQRVARQPQNVIVKPSSPHFVGDNGSTEELMRVVRELLQERPQTFKELLDATGARDNRIKGVIMRLQREGVKVINMSPIENRALWFIPDPQVLKRIMHARATARR